jgi:DNA-binding NarL/FixJ family response regulator
MPLVGRDEELALVDALLARGRAQGDALLLYGEPGVGKSTIASEAVTRAQAAGATVLTTTGVPSASELPYAALHQLLWPVLPDPALGMGADPFRTGLAVLGLLGDVAERAPVVVVAEDAHWIDEPTSEVLAFVARRIEADPIAMLITSRESIPRSLRGARVPSRKLAPLRDGAAEALLYALDPRLPPATRKRILAEAQGNPLGLVELLAGAARADADLDLPAGLPLSARLERTFAARVADLPAATRDALVVAALSDRTDVTEVLAAASRLNGAPLGLEVFTPAVAAGLVEVDELRVRFGHPLMRSAIGLGEHRAAHEALAAVLADDPARSIRHRVAAAGDTDDGLADELAATANDALRRGAVVTAARTLGRAAALTGEEPARGARLLDAAELALDIGRDDLVEQLLAGAAPLALAPDDLPRRAWLERISRLRAPAPAWFEAHLDRIEELDGERASQALLTVAFRSWWADVPQPLRDRMTAQARGAPEVIRMAALALVEPVVNAAEVRDWLERVEPDDIPGELLRLAAISGPIVAAFDRGIVLGDRAIERLRARGRYGLLAPALVGRAWSGVHAGGWSATLAAAQDAHVVAQETGQPLWSVAALAAAAALNGLRGDLDSALALADESAATLPTGTADGMLAMVEYARGLAYLNAGHPDDALAHLRRVLEGDGFVARWAVAEAVEAAVQRNDRPAGHAIVQRAAALPHRSPHFEASLAYARLLLATEAEADALAATALATASPALRARAQLAHGGWLRRRRRAGEARALLRAARDTFEALDMATRAERVRAELRAAGEAVRTAAVDPAAVLTPQELQIARMAADGLSNREIGQALYLSHRTIGSNLYKVFPKLGVASRGELRALLQSA